MLFNSYQFIFAYVPVVLSGFFLIARRNRLLATVWLAAASLFFYGWWNAEFVLLLLGSISFNYAMGNALSRIRGSRLADIVLAFAVTANLATLCVFKYSNFFISTVNLLGGWYLPLVDVILPLGISFFTFTQIGFLVDVRRGATREYNFVHYILFVSYFPHLIAGPILTYDNVMKQFLLPETYRPSAENLTVGTVIFAIGLAKKVLLADPLGQYVVPVFDHARLGGDPHLFSAWAGVLAYSLQIYFDFSGYSDMAIGVSRLFGIRLPANFNSPYKASSIVEFWRRWHMTLSQFLLKHVYIPIGGNRAGKPRRYLGVVVTMLLGGLWHGANWTFVAWGALHASYIAINVAWRSLKERMGRSGAGSSSVTGRWSGRILTLLAVAVSWVFFRADTFSAAMAILKGTIGLNGIFLPESAAELLEGKLPASLKFVGVFADIDGIGSPSTLMLLLLVGAGLLCMPNTQQLLADYGPTSDGATIASKWKWRPTFVCGLATGAVFVLSLMKLGQSPSEFLYYQF